MRTTTETGLFGIPNAQRAFLRQQTLVPEAESKGCSEKSPREDEHNRGYELFPAADPIDSEHSYSAGDSRPAVDDGIAAENFIRRQLSRLFRFTLRPALVQPVE